MSAAALAVAMLAACGNSAASDPMCGSTGQVGSLIVTRAVLNRGYFSFPARVTVSSRAKAQAVAEAACALPTMTSQPVACPADLGPTYRLAFSTAAGRKLATAHADPTGCVSVTGLGGTRTAAGSPDFWRTLGQAMGLSHPGREAFLGT